MSSVAADAVAAPKLLERKWVRIVFGVAVSMMAVVALHALSREVTISSLREAIAATPFLDIALALGATALSFVGLGLYDLIATRVVAPGRVRAPMAFATGASAYAVSNVLGFALITGGAVRERIYRRCGLEPSQIANVMASSWLSFWLGTMLVTGVLLLVDPTGPASRLGLPGGVDVVVGVALLAAVLGLLVWTARGARVLRWRDTEFRVPGLRQTLAQIGASLLDVGAAAAALWFLLPTDIAIGPATFFAAYVAAIVVGIISHSPGGLGAFEATLIAALGLTGRADVLASLVLYRLVYYLVPFVLLAVCVAGLTATSRREALRGRAASAWSGMNKLVAPLVPPVAAGLVGLAGTILLLSGALPSLRPRREALEAIAPLAVVETSHLVGSMIGVVLLIVAFGLAHRNARAWTFAMLALASGLVASLAKGLDWEEATILALALGALSAFRDAFYRTRGERPSWSWLLAVAIVLAVSVWLGFLSYRNVAYANDLWWRFAWNGEASRFLRASVAAAVVLAAFAAFQLLRRSPDRGVPEEIPAAVRRMVGESRDTEANLALLGDKRFLVSPDASAFLMYRETRTAAVALRDPFGERDAATMLAWRFLEQADAAGRIPAFYGVGTAMLPTYLDMGLSILKIGEVARVDLAGFSLEGSRRKPMRQTVSRAERDGLSFRVLDPAETVSRVEELRIVSDLWLRDKSGSEKSFALGNFDEAYLANFPHAVMEHEGRIVAFANLWPGAEHEELSLDLMRYDPSAPGSAMQALFAHMMLWGKAEGYRWFNLGAAPFSGLSDHRLARRWNRMGAFVYEHGDRFYHFEGLRAFKEKFDPVWTPNYVACPGGLAAGRVLLEVNRMVSGGLSGLLK